MRENSIIKDIKTAVPVACTLFGCVVGPALASGTQCTVYFARYGCWGLVTPFIFFAFVCFIVFFGLDLLRASRIYDYDGQLRVLFGKYYKYALPINEIRNLITVAVSLMIMYSMAGSMLSEWGFPYLAGMLLVAVVSIILTLFGGGFIRALNTFLAVGLVSGMLIIVVLGLKAAPNSLSLIVSSWQVPDEGLFWSASWTIIVWSFTIGVSYSSGVSGVAETLKTRRQVMLASVIGVAITTIFILAGVCLCLPYCPEVIGQSAPFLWIVSEYLSANGWIYWVYFALIFFALFSSSTVVKLVVCLRVEKLFIDKKTGKYKILKNHTLRWVVICAIISLIGIAGAQLGVITLLSQALPIVGYCALALILLPLFIRGKKLINMYDSGVMEPGTYDIGNGIERNTTA